MTALEIAVQDPEGALVAARAGADRVELCTALAIGGTTPSRALVQAAVATDLPVHVLVRPRPGGFDYSAAERAVILDDVRYALDAGAAGVVVGATRGDAVDEDLVAQARRVAGSAQVAFHRAFDTLTDRRAVLDVLVGLGVDRVLTAGGATRAPDALAELERLVAHAGGRIAITAGGGIDPSSAARVAATGVAAIHASAKRSVADALPIGLGSLAGAGSTREVTDEATVRALRAALDARTAPR